MHEAYIPKDAETEGYFVEMIDYARGWEMDTHRLGTFDTLEAALTAARQGYEAAMEEAVRRGWRCFSAETFIWHQGRVIRKGF